MTRSSPSGTKLVEVNLNALVVLSMVLILLEDGWHQSLLHAIMALLIVPLLGTLVYRLYTNWGDLVAQYGHQELFRDRVLTLLEVLNTVAAGIFAVSMFTDKHPQTWMGSGASVLRVVIALLLVLVAIPGVVHMWVALKNRKSGLGQPHA